VGEEEELPQRVQRLPLVELAVDPAPELLALQISQDEDRLDQAAVLQQGARQGVLAAVGLEPVDQQRGGDPPPLQRSRDAQQVVPPAQDPIAANPALEPRREIPIRPAPVQALELLVAQVADSP